MKEDKTRLLQEGELSQERMQELDKDFKEEIEHKETTKWKMRNPNDYSENDIKYLLDKVMHSEKQRLATRSNGRNSYPPSLYDTNKELGENDIERLERRRVSNSIYAWYKLPKVYNDDVLEERTDYFFQSIIASGEIPTVEKYAMAIGYHVEQLRAWRNGTVVVSQRRLDLITKAFDFMHAMESELVLLGKINPTAYIFRSKNLFGMKDQQDVVISDSSGLGNKKDLDSIIESYEDNIIDAEYEEK